MDLTLKNLLELAVQADKFRLSTQYLNSYIITSQRLFSLKSDLFLYHFELGQNLVSGSEACINQLSSKRQPYLTHSFLTE